MKPAPAKKKMGVGRSLGARKRAGALKNLACDVGQAVLMLAGLSVLLAAEAKAGMQVTAIAKGLRST
jgi:hypothetical protein